MDTNYDHLHIITPKGRKKIIQSFATEQGKSLSVFVNESINEKMERDKEGGGAPDGEQVM